MSHGAARRGLLSAVLLLACASRPALPPAGPRPTASAPVNVYGATWCRYTRAAIDWFNARGIPAQLRNVESDTEAWDEMAERARRAGLSTRGIPVLEVRGRILVGFHPEDIERALEE